MDRGRDGSDAFISQGTPRIAGNRQGRIPILRLQSGSGPASTLISDFRPSEPRQSVSVVLKPASL